MNGETFILDRKGKQIAVQLSVRRYRKLIAAAEELEDIKAYRKAKRQKSEPILFEQAFQEIEQSQ